MTNDIFSLHVQDFENANKNTLLFAFVLPEHKENVADSTNNKFIYAIHTCNARDEEYRTC